LTIWTLQAWLAMFLFGAAYAKLTQPMDLLEVLLGWPAGVESSLVQVVGLTELCLGLGLLAPLISWRIFGRIMAVAALGVVLAGGAMAVVHLTRLEFGFAMLNAIISAAAVTVRVGRCPLRRKGQTPVGRDAPERTVQSTDRGAELGRAMLRGPHSSALDVRPLRWPQPSTR
jgi:hypothetical protein